MNSFLSGLGLSEKEVELYLCALQIGPQTASTFANKTGFARSTVNFIFGELIQKGFAHKDVREKTSYFKGIPPESIGYILLQKQAEVKKQTSDFQELLPLLNGLTGKNTLVPKVTYYEGLEALQRAIEAGLEKDESAYFISSHNNMHPKVREHIEQVYIPRSKKKINKNQMILSDGDEARKYLKKAEGVYDEVILVDPKANPFKLTVGIRGNSVDFISYDPQDLSGVIIENRLIAEHMRTIFEVLKRCFKGKA